MAREEFDTCPKCGIGKMKPTRGAISATSADPDTNRLTGDSYQEYKCDSCGYPEGGQAKAVQVSDEQEGIGNPVLTAAAATTTTTAVATSTAKTTNPFNKFYYYLSTGRIGKTIFKTHIRNIVMDIKIISFRIIVTKVITRE